MTRQLIHSQAVPVLYKGVPFESIKSLGSYLGLTEHQIQNILPSDPKTTIYNKEVNSYIEDYYTGKTEYFLFNRGFKNQTTLANHFGIDPKVVAGINFRYNGMRDIFEKKIIEAVHSEPIFYDNQEFKDLSDFCTKYKQDYTVLVRLMASGMSLDDALHYEVKTPRGWEIEFRGKTYNSKRDLLNKHGYSLNFSTSLRQFFDPKRDIEVFGLYLDFIKEKGFADPVGYITGLPMVYYNGDYFLKAKDFYAAIGVTNRNVTHEQNAKENIGLTKTQITLNMGERINLLKGTRLFPNAIIEKDDYLVFVREEFLEYASEYRIKKDSL